MAHLDAPLGATLDPRPAPGASGGIGHADHTARPPRPSFRRSRSNRVIGGVAAGVAHHLGADPLAVRVVFTILALAAGFGVAVYLVLWVLAPLEPEGAAATAASSARLPRATRQQLLGLGLIAVGVVIVLSIAGAWFGDDLAWPVALAGIGFAVLWARTSADEGRLDLSNLGSPLQVLLRGQVSLPRVLIGGALIVGGLGVFLAATTSLSAAANVVLAVIVTAGGIALLGGPWIWRMANQLIDERSSRIRSEARAEMAAHLHDSVLQTLALIQRAREPREMASLARTQERELRAWLYGRSPSVRGARLRDAIDALADRVERQHQVRVEAVVVGDLPLDEDLRALVAACSEATSNAARHSGSGDVSVYVEIEPDLVSAYVRDQGSGFDPAAVPSDRRGISESIVGRMARHGGSAAISSRPSDGTEVVLRLPRSVP